MAARHVFIIPPKSEKFFILRKSEYFSKMYDAQITKIKIKNIVSTLLGRSPKGGHQRRGAVPCRYPSIPNKSQVIFTR